MGVYFGELKKQADPNILLRGPTTQREFEEGNRQLLHQAGGVPKK